MKNILVTSLVFLPGILLLSCKKQSNVIPIGMSAIVNNTQWTATSYSATIDTNIDSIVDLNISGIDSNWIGSYPNLFSLVITGYKNTTGITLASQYN